MEEVNRKKTTSLKKIDDIKKKKELFKVYFKALPVIKLTAGKIGVARETIYNWMDDDPQFKDDLEALKYDYAIEHLAKVKSKEWILERVLREYFTPRQEIVGEEVGKPLLVSFIKPISDIENITAKPPEN